MYFGISLFLWHYQLAFHIIGFTFREDKRVYSADLEIEASQILGEIADN